MLQPALRSRVGRRLLVRFLLAALLPIAGLAWFAYLQVGQILLESAHEHLAREGKAYGMSLVAGLNAHAGALQQAVERADGALPRGVPGFVEVSLIDPQPEQQGRVADPGLRLLPGEDPSIIRALPDGVGRLLGRIDGERFWNNLSAPEHFCVFNAAREVLHCSAGLDGVDGSIIPPGDREQNSAVSEGRIGDAEHLLGFWHARYLPALDSAGFIVMVAMPKDQALEDLLRFRTAFPAVVLLAVALAAGLSIRQIRQQMAPLDRLQASTRRLSAGDLQARAGIPGADEFAQLGEAFDRMAGHLQRKFHTLELLSELDRAILDSSERGQIAEQLLRKLQQSLPCEAAGVLLIEDAGSAQLICCHAERGCARQTVDTAELPDVPLVEAWLQLPSAALPAAWIEALHAQGVGQWLVFPALLNSRLDSLLLLGYASPPQQLEEIAQVGRGLADRLAVAASSIARERMLYQQAHYDLLTGLPNRLLLRDRTEQAIAQARRTGTGVGLLFIDLDGFKQVNDSLGHGMGDALLVECARRLRARMRQGDTVARLGGDEFVVLIPDMARDAAYAVADRMARDLNEMLAEPLQLGEQQVVSPASIGIALYPDNASSHQELLRMADEAMYEAKRRNTGSYCFYTSNISAQTRDRFELTQELRDAIQRRELLLHYQPKVDARSGRLAGAEALLRWQSPKRGMVSPGLFVNLLDEMGLSTWLGEWVLDQACAQMQAWDARGFPAFPVSVNFSPLQFERTPVLERVQAALEAYGLRAERLELEILESMAASQSPEVRQSLIQLRELGVRISLDDFGTGFSSLVHLAQLPTDIVKLDRVFIHSLCSESRQRSLVELIIAMAKVMDLKVVAEGVEEEAQRQLLPELGCDLLQGYLIGRPVAPEAFAARWLVSA